jgi:hypothetical protein
LNDKALKIWLPAEATLEMLRLNLHMSKALWCILPSTLQSVVGGTMSLLTRSRLFGAGVICASIAAVCFALLALLLLTGAFIAKGSREGEILRIGFGVLFLFISFLFVFFGSALRNSSKSRSKNYAA